jgi:hypothetical protein
MPPLQLPMLFDLRQTKPQRWFFADGSGSNDYYCERVFQQYAAHRNDSRSSYKDEMKTDYTVFDNHMQNRSKFIAGLQEKGSGKKRAYIKKAGTPSSEGERYNFIYAQWGVVSATARFVNGGVWKSLPNNAIVADFALRHSVVADFGSGCRGSPLVRR